MDNDSLEDMEWMEDDIAGSSPPVPLPTGYMSIFHSQDTTGYFSSLPPAYVALGKSIPEPLKDLEDSEWVWLTVLALAILSHEHKATKAEWAMMAKKAEKYLKDRGVRVKGTFATLVTKAGETVDLSDEVAKVIQTL